MQANIEADEHHPIGPTGEQFGHGPVIVFGDELFACLDCGYVADDNRLLAHEECNREDNPITETLRERYESDGVEAAIPVADTDKYPLG